MVLSPGTVATDMQKQIKKSGINPVSKMDWEDHIPSEWVAKCLVWMCGKDSDRYLGKVVSLREEGIRKTIKWYLENEIWWREIQNKKYNQERLGA